jgi:hypothetical protein
MLMAYYRPEEVSITAEPGATNRYIWGDKLIAFHHCTVCGCTTHWEPLGPGPHDRMGVNARLMDPTVIEGVRVRRFDGAETWKFLD